MTILKINKLQIKGDNNIVFQDADGKEQRIALEVFVQLFTKEKDARIADLERTIEDKAKIERYSDDENLRLGRELSRLKSERDNQEKRIEELLKEYDGKDINQTSQLYQEAFALFMSGKLEDAIEVLDEGKLLQQEEQAQAIREKQAEARLLKARMLQINLDFEKAAFNYEKATQIYPSWAYHLEAAYYYQRQKDYQKVEKHYLLSLKHVESEEQKASSLNNLGIYYKDTQKMPQAEAAFDEAIRIYRQLANNKSDIYLPDIARVLHNLGTFYWKNQKMFPAEEALNEALGMRRLLADKNPMTFLPDVATTLNNLGGLFYDNQKMSQAEDAFIESLKIRRQLSDKNAETFLPYVATTLNNLGACYNENQKMLQAEETYIEALKINRQLAEKNPDAFLSNVAMTLSNLGNHYWANQKMKQSEAALNEALKIQSKLAQKNPDVFLPNVAMTLNSLGNYYLTNQRVLESEKTLKEALSIRRKLAADNPSAFLMDVAHTLNNIGNCYHESQYMSEAEMAYSEALAIFKELLGENQEASLPYYAQTLGNLGVQLFANQKTLEAEKAFHEALVIFTQLADENPNAYLPYVASTLNNLIILNVENPQKAVVFVEKCLEIGRELAIINPDAQNLELARILMTCGFVYLDLDEEAQSQAYFKEALSIAELYANVPFAQEIITITKENIK